MATMKRGILGGLSGKVGDVVGSSWKGIAVLKTRPLSVSNPRTAGQVAQRTKFANVVAFASVILASIIKPLWDRFQTGQSGYNAFTSTNVNFFESELPSPPASLVISKGKMLKTEISAIDYSIADGTCKVDWSDVPSGGFQTSDDKAYLVGIDSQSSEVVTSSGVVLRSAGTETLTFSANPSAGDTVYVYLAFQRPDGTIVSDNSYLNAVAS